MRNVTIGFDLGTSATKVVFRDNDDPSVKVWAVPFIRKEYFTPTRLYVRKEHYLLDLPEDDYEVINNIKDQLLNGNKKSIEIAVAYMGLVLRECLQWFLSENHESAEEYNPNYRSVNKLTVLEKLKSKLFAIRNKQRQSSISYHNIPVEWSINIGMPCNYYEQSKFKTVYHTAIKAAWVLATLKNDISINSTTVQVVIKDVEENNEYGIHDDLVEEIPEIVAEIIDYGNSSQRSPGIHAIIDVGASTVDIAILSIVKDNHNLTFSVFASSVVFCGVHYMIQDMLELSLPQFLEWLEKNGGMGGNLPENILKRSLPDVYKKHERQLLPHLLKCLKTAKEIAPFGVTGTGENPWENKGLKTFIVGGGSLMQAYTEAVENANRSAIKEYKIRGYQIDNILYKGANYRLNVAFGLSISATIRTKVCFKHESIIVDDNHYNQSNTSLGAEGKDAC